jgi:molybdenum cofactor guanylyltransferase
MTLTAVLLTGGLSRRMGTDKATMAVAGKSAWIRQLALLRELRPEVLWLSARSRPVWCPPELEVILDTPPSRGPLSGLAAALHRLETSHLFVVAIDLPRLTPEMLSRLWSLAQPGCGVIPVNDGHYEPLCAVYPKAAAAVAEASLAANNLSLQNLATRLLDGNLLRMHTLTRGEQPLFHNMNTAADGL